MGNMIDIGGRIHNPEVGNVVAGANEIYDDTKQKKQNVINAETDASLLNLSQNKQDNLIFDNAPTKNSINPVTSGGVYAADAALQSAIEAILLLIPSAASALNQLADKAFVNSSIATNTATFRGTYNSVSDLHLAVDATHAQIEAALDSTISTADNNDYCYVQIPVSATSFDIEKTERYKFNGTGWKFEYQLNNSGFTAAQWAAINSGITAALVGDLNFIKSIVPAEATTLNQLADKAYVLAQILAATPAFKGQFTTLADLQAVVSPKDGDLGIVRTKDSDGYDVFTFYQYLNDAWNVFYTLAHHNQKKPATTGSTGDYPNNGMGRIVLDRDVDFKSQIEGQEYINGNYIFVIQYDFTLTGNVTIPANCVLEFEGGSVDGANTYSITFNDTILKSINGNVFSNISILGSIKGVVNVSWFTLVNSFDTYNINLLDGLSKAVNAGGGTLKWDTESIYILCQENKSIRLAKGDNDFNNTTFFVKSPDTISAYSGFVMRYEGEVTQLAETTVADCVASNVFKDKFGVLNIYDETPIAQRSGYGYNATRRDLIGVANNRALNNTVLPYDTDADTVLNASYFLVDYCGINVRNATFVRNGEGVQNTFIRISNACNVTVSDICMITKSTTESVGGLDSQLSFDSCYNLTLKNIIANEEYGIDSDYVISMNNVYNVVYDNVNATGHWGITGGNNINKATIRNSRINRFDSHCYSKDFNFENCELFSGYTQISVHLGIISYNNCSFGDYTAANAEGSYNALTNYTICLSGCSFVSSENMKIWSGINSADPATRRDIIKDSYLPQITMSGCNVTLPSSANYVKLYDRARIQYTSYKNIMCLHIDTLHQNTGNLYFAFDEYVNAVEAFIDSYQNDDYANGCGIGFTSSAFWGTSTSFPRNQFVTINNSQTTLNHLIGMYKSHNAADTWTNRITFNRCRLHFSHSSADYSFGVQYTAINFVECDFYCGTSYLPNARYERCIISGVGLSYSSTANGIIDHCWIRTSGFGFNPSTDEDKLKSLSLITFSYYNNKICPIGRQVVRNATDISNILASTWTIPLLEASTPNGDEYFYINKVSKTASEFYNRT